MSSKVRQAASKFTALTLIFALSCSSSSNSGGARSEPYGPDDADAIRYRLLLRENPEDPGEAFRCYGGCQKAESPEAYLQCLGGCPGFEMTPGVRCAKYEVPPVAACLTARKLRPQSEVEPGWIVVGVLANVLIVVAAASLCASSASQCGYYQYYPPPR